MQKWYLGKGFLLFLFSCLISSVFFLYSFKGGRRDLKQETIKSDKNPVMLKDNGDSRVFLKFRSFQNADSTWGFNIFLNAKPYLHYKSIPYANSSKGFILKKDADKVGDFFVKMILSGDLNPELNKKSLDSLKIVVN